MIKNVVSISNSLLTEQYREKYTIIKYVTVLLKYQNSAY